MNCQHVQDELLLLIDRRQLPDELQEHVDRCDRCRQVWTELCSLRENLGRDEDFEVDDQTVEAIVASVDRRLDKLEMARVTDVRASWMTYIPAAAAVVIIVGISVIVYLSGWLSTNGGQAQAPADDSLWVSLAENDISYLDNTDLTQLISQIGADHDEAIETILLEDITEEELEYLEKTFDVGEIL